MWEELWVKTEQINPEHVVPFIPPSLSLYPIISFFLGQGSLSRLRSFRFPPWTWNLCGRHVQTLSNLSIQHLWKIISGVVIFFARGDDTQPPRIIVIDA